MSEGDFFERIGTGIRDTKGNKAEPVQGISPAIDPNRDKLRRWQDGSQRLWIKIDDQYYEGRPVAETVSSGLYEFVVDSSFGTGLKNVPINTDELIIPTDNALKSILEEFKLFWKSKHKFRERGLLFKRGFIVWGPPGAGKTCLIGLLNSYLIKEYGGIVVNVDHPNLAIDGLQLVRKIEPERPLILIFEDIDALIERYGESQFLSLLDGENQIENVVSIATTNYPERLDPRFVNRPSRFYKVIEVGMPNETTRRLYLQTKEKSLTDKELNEWVLKSKDFSLAHLKEMIVAVKCLDQPLEEVLARLKKMRYTPKSHSGQNPAGFKGWNEEFNDEGE